MAYYHPPAAPDFSSQRYSIGDSGDSGDSNGNDNAAPPYSDPYPGPAYPPFPRPAPNHAQQPYADAPEAQDRDSSRRSSVPAPSGMETDSRAQQDGQAGGSGSGDIGMVFDRRGSWYGYHDAPYDEEYSQRDGSAPSVAPWDSASQADDHVHYPLPYPSSEPLSGQHVAHKASFAGGLSYIDDQGTYYQSDRLRPGSEVLDSDYKDDYEMRRLVSGAATMGNAADIEDGRNNDKFAPYNDEPYMYPPEPSNTANMRQPSTLYSLLLFPTGLDRLLALFGIRAGKFPIEQAIERKRHGIGGQRWPVASWAIAAAMCGLMVYELVRNNSLTGSPIAKKPAFNYMIGPTAEVLINIGARFPPCMKYVPDLPPTFQLACLNDTASTPTTSCSLETICGHGGFPSGVPDQSWRFVYPIFLHVGIIHLLLNMLAQLTAAAQVEREMGTVPFLIVYMAGGIYGFVLGGNFSRTGVPSVGASGALFATNACVLVDLILHWKYEERPKLKAFLLAIEFIIGFAIGYIPSAVDGLAHLGGWAMGILFGVILYPSISETKRHRYAVWAARVIATPLIILAFVLTIKNFYTTDPNAACEWCRYLSCIPVKSNTYCKGTGITVSTSTNTRRWEL